MYRRKLLELQIAPSEGFPSIFILEAATAAQKRSTLDNPLCEMKHSIADYFMKQK